LSINLIYAKEVAEHPGGCIIPGKMKEIQDPLAGKLLLPTAGAGPRKEGPTIV
jgi:hypothetical protein